MSVKSLPEKPNTEFLRKEAKELLSSARSGNSAAVQRLINVKTSSTSKWQLSDAQYTIAREYGFSSWNKLRDHVLQTHPAIRKAISNLRSGELCILFDDEGRENEGDFVVAAEKITAEQVNFITKHGRGTLAIAISPEIARQFSLETTKKVSDSSIIPAFAQSFDAAECETGISSKDRSVSIRKLMDESATADDLRFPGHTHPLVEHKGKLRDRKGHTEGSLELMRRAGLKQGAAICEILNEDGTMARLPDLEKVAKKFQLPIVRISELS